MTVIAKGAVQSVPVWFEEGERLIVLAIIVMPTGGPKYLLWSKRQQSVGLFPISEFGVLDPTLPVQWVAKTGVNGHLELSSAEWQVDGFWERYHDEDQEAVKLFETCYKALTGQVLGA